MNLEHRFRFSSSSNQSNDDRQDAWNTRRVAKRCRRVTKAPVTVLTKSSVGRSGIQFWALSSPHASATHCVDIGICNYKTTASFEIISSSIVMFQPHKDSVSRPKYLFTSFGPATCSIELSTKYCIYNARTIYPGRSWLRGPGVRTPSHRQPYISMFSANSRSFFVGKNTIHYRAKQFLYSIEM